MRIWLLSVAFIALAQLSRAEEGDGKYHLRYYADDVCKPGVSKVIYIDESGINSSLILQHSKSSQFFNGNCSLQIHFKTNDDVDVEVDFRQHGLLVTSQKFYSSDSNGCNNFVEFINETKQSISKWCGNSSVQEFGVPKKFLNLTFATSENGTLAFEIVFTVYKSALLKSCPFQIHCRHDGQNFCVSTLFKCDGIRNCIENEDETQCEPTPPPPITTAATTTAATTSTFPSTTEETTTIKVSTTTKETTTTKKTTTTTQLSTTTIASTTTEPPHTSPTTKPTEPSTTEAQPSTTSKPSEAASTKTEVIVFSVVAALIVCVVVYFLGRWIHKKRQQSTYQRL